MGSKKVKLFKSDDSPPVVETTTGAEVAALLIPKKSKLPFFLSFFFFLLSLPGTAATTLEGEREGTREESFPLKEGREESL